MTDIEESYWTSPVRESAKFNVTKGERLKAASPMVCIDGAIPPEGGIESKHIAMGVSWFHSFLLRVLQNLLTENERRLTPTVVPPVMLSVNSNHLILS